MRAGRWRLVRPACRRRMRANGVRPGGNHHRVSLARILAVVQLRRHVSAPVNYKLRRGFLQLVVHPRPVFFRLAVEQAAHALKPRQIRKLVQCDPSALDLGHAVIAHHHQVDRQSGRVQAGLQLAHQPVHLEHRRLGLGRIRAKLVPLVIRLRVVKRYEMRPVCLRQAQPREYLLNACRVVNFVIEFQVVGRLKPGDLGLRARPEKARGPHPLALCQAPQRRAAVPGPVGHRPGIGDPIARLLGLIPEAVGHQPVMLGIKPGYDRKVVGKRKRWVARQHAFRSPYAVLAQGQQVLGLIALGVIPAKPVERNQHHVMLGPRLG